MNKSAEPYVIASASVMGHIRKTKHLSQQKMAILCGIPLARYKAYENAMMPLTLFHLESICNKTGESIDMIVYYIYTKLIFNTETLRDPYYMNLLNSLSKSE